ncbi:helix-turn-helix domain-containing protein [Streptomyces sp. NPDC048106]|uniref:helix-turn-helix domain-containing protein n=1 Tax=Streptomyces sp. NPDC048106 TaxID=3155750 RepID=UPI0034538097
MNDRLLPTLIPAPLAAQEAGVAPATIRKWVQLGHLRPAGKSGRAHLFRLEDVFQAERTTRRATRRPAPPSP